MDNFKLNVFLGFFLQKPKSVFVGDCYECRKYVGADQQTKYMANYLDALSSVERLHRLLLDVIKDEFERLGHLELNAVQALLLFNIGDN